MSLVNTRKIGDSYSANPNDLVRLRELATESGVAKSELIRRAIRRFLNDAADRPEVVHETTGD